MEEEQEVVAPRRGQRGGIKSATFHGNGRPNGVSHRKNATRKKNQYNKNKRIRSDLYARKSSVSPTEWHMVLASLSAGTA